MAALATPGAKRAAFLIIDVQNDFIDGPMTVPGGADIIPQINKLRKGVKWTLVALSQDNHPPNHMSFFANHVNDPKAREWQELEVNGMKQVLWPVHCVQKSDGNKFHSDLVVEDSDVIVPKGENPEVDSYSAFYDNDHKSSTGMTKILQDARIEDVYLCGLAFDYCVGFSAIDAAKAGFNVFVIEDCCRSIAGTSEAKMRRQLKENGVTLIQSNEVLRTYPNDKKQEAAEYFQKKNIMPLLQNLTAKLLLKKPNDPRAFLIEQLKAMKESKTDVKEVTSVLLTDKDLRVIFKKCDTSECGTLNGEQCRQGLLSAGIPPGEIVVGAGDRIRFNAWSFIKLARAGLKAV